MGKKAVGHRDGGAEGRRRRTGSDKGAERTRTKTTGLSRAPSFSLVDDIPSGGVVFALPPLLLLLLLLTE